jgi:peptidoglycan/LPS O-acetylase OafA/YrhL
VKLLYIQAGIVQFRKDINGLRAIAVIAVVLFHFNPSWMPGGFAGVDVFFVISGFLMTGIIFSSLEQEKFSILKFYVARANRIIPALAVLCLVLLIFGWFYLTPLDYKALGKHAGGSISFISNIIFWNESGYFDVSSHGKWLLHTWSLSVEWQFYIIYPLMLVVMGKFMTVKIMKATVLLGAALGFIFCVFVTYKWPNAAYYLLPTRAWEMMVGGIAYLYPFTLQQKNKKLFEWFGLTLIVGSYFLISKDNPWPGYLALFPVLGAFLLLQAKRNDSFITSNVLFQKIGVWSYSIYLWHWPLVVAIYYFSLNHIYIYLGMTLSICLGFLSHKYIEKIRFRNDFSNLFVYVKCKPLYMILFVGLISFYNYYLDGENGWKIRQNLLTQKTYSVLEGRTADINNWQRYVDGDQDFSRCRFNMQTLTNDGELRLKECEAKYGSGILILGDSHANELFTMVASKFYNEFIVGVTSTEGCRPHTEKNHCKYEKLADFISKNNHVFNHVIYEQGGFYLLLDEDGNKGSRNMFSKLPLSKSVEGINVNMKNINIVSAYLSSISAFVPVTWFGSRVEPHFTNRHLLQKGCDFEFKLRPNQKAVFYLLDYHIENNISHLKNIKFLSQNETFKYQFPQDFMNCKKILWDDSDHLSSFGEETISKRLPDSFLHY